MIVSEPHLLIQVETIWWPAIQLLMALPAKQGHILPCQTRTGISVWICERRQDIASALGCFVQGRRWVDLRSAEKVIFPTGVTLILQINLLFLKTIAGLSFLSLHLSLCPCCLDLNSIHTPWTSMCGLNDSPSWLCREQRKSWELEIKLIILPFPGPSVKILYSPLFIPKELTWFRGHTLRRFTTAQQALLEVLLCWRLKMWRKLKFAIFFLVAVLQKDR